MWIPSGNGSGGSGPIVTTPLFSVVLNSAGPAGPNVFTTWAALYAAMVAVPGGARVTVVGTQHVTAGGPYAVSGWEFVAAGSDVLDTLVIDAGASFATPCAVTFGLAVTSNTLAGAPPFDASANGVFLGLSTGAWSGGMVKGGANGIVYLTGYTLSQHGGVPCTAGAVTVYAFNASNIMASALSGTETVWIDPSTTYGLGTNPVPRSADFAPGTPSYNPAWYAQTAVYIDPQNVSGVASDANAGTTAGAPLLTWGEVERRYGSDRPLFNVGQSCTYTLLSSQTAGVDPIFFEPRVSGGGQAILIAAPTVFAAAFVGGAVTAKTRGAPGQLLTVASMPAGTLKNMLVVNTTRSSQALIDSMSGTTATMQQPQTTASLTSTAVVPAPVEDDTWATGDTLVIYSLISVNLKRWCPVGGDLTAALQPSGGWVFTASIADTSGNGTSAYEFSNFSAVNVLVNCVVNPHVAAGSIGGRQSELFLVGCSMPTGTTQLYSGELEVYGGGLANLTLTTSGPCLVANDAILHGTIKSNGGSLLLEAPGVFCDGTYIIVGSYVEVDSFAWGSYNVTLDPGGKWWNNTGSTFVLKALLTSGALKLGTATAGATYTAATGLWSAGNVALTPAAIDGAPGGAIVNPLTGAGFSSSQ